MVSVTSAVGTAVESVQDAVGALKVLVRSGLLNPTNPKETLTTVKRAKTIGPCGSVVAHGAEEYPDAGAIADEKGELTYGELDAHANALANHLLASGIERGSVIGVIARDHRGLLTTMSAAGKAGLRLAMMNTGFGKTQFVEVAEREKVTAMLYDEEFGDLADALPPEILRIVTWVDGKRPIPDGVRTLEDITATGDTSTPAEPDEWAGLVILTSGTTGLPKGAQRTKLSPFSSALIVDRIPVPRRGTAVIVSPIFHSTGFALWGVAAALGNKAVVLRRFDPEKTLAALAEHRAEMLVAVPTMLHRILALGPETIAKYDTSALRVIVIAGSRALPDTLGGGAGHLRRRALQPLRLHRGGDRVGRDPRGTAPGPGHRRPPPGHQPAGAVRRRGQPHPRNKRPRKAFRP